MRREYAFGVLVLLALLARELAVSRFRFAAMRRCDVSDGGGSSEGIVVEARLGLEMLQWGLS